MNNKYLTEAGSPEGAKTNWKNMVQLGTQKHAEQHKNYSDYDFEELRKEQI